MTFEVRPMARRQPRLLDLFSGAGGCAAGYARAGFEVVGVDMKKQPRYPFTHIVGDALEYVAKHGKEFDVIHASPPCQRYTRLGAIHGRDNHPDLIAETRRLLDETGKPWVVENVVGSPLSPFAVTLCGLMFGLGVIRHRLFESSVMLFSPPHPTHGRRGEFTQKRGLYDRGERGLMTVAGHNFCPVAARVAMGIGWMTGKELAQAVPPAYCEHLGKQLIRVVGE